MSFLLSTPATKRTTCINESNMWPRSLSLNSYIICGITWVPSIRFPITPDQSASLDQYPRSFWRHFSRISCCWLTTVPVAMVHIPFTLQGFPQHPGTIGWWFLYPLKVIGKRPHPQMPKPTVPSHSLYLLLSFDILSHMHSWKFPIHKKTLAEVYNPELWLPRMFSFDDSYSWQRKACWHRTHLTKNYIVLDHHNWSRYCKKGARCPVVEYPMCKTKLVEEWILAPFLPFNPWNKGNATRDSWSDQIGMAISI